MKSLNIMGAVMVAAALYIGCKTEVVSENSVFPALEPLNADTNAGTWKPILLSKPDEFAVNNPIAVTSADYKLELLEIKSRQNNITDEERDMMNYWSAGVVLRWNEIMRELVAKYNLPPYQNPDGTYPIPVRQTPWPTPSSLLPILLTPPVLMLICQAPNTMHSWRLITTNPNSEDQDPPKRIHPSSN